MLNNDIGDSSDSDDEGSFDDTTKLSVSTAIVASGKENNDSAESQYQDNSTDRSNSDEESQADDLNSENNNDSIISEDYPTNVPEMADKSTQMDESMLPTLLAIVKSEEDTRGDESEGEVKDNVEDTGETSNDSSDISGGYQLVKDAHSFPEKTEAAEHATSTHFFENEIEELESKLDSEQGKTETLRNELSEANDQLESYRLS